MQWRTIGKLLAAFALSAFLLWLLFKQISVAQIMEVFTRLPFWLIIACLGLYALLHFCRALRLRLLIPEQPFRIALSVSLLHNILIVLLPFRLGELSFPYLLKKRGVSVPKSLAALAVSRLFDTLGLCIYLLLGMWMLIDVLPASVHVIAKYTTILAAVLIIGMYITIIHLKSLLKHIRTKRRMFRTLLAKLHELLDGLAILRKQHVLWQISLLSLASWGFQFLWSWILFRELLQANFWAIMVGTALPIVSTAIPIQGIAAFGTFEGVWMLIFTAFGVGKELAIASGFAYHIINILYALILGLVGAALFIGEHKQ